MRHIGSLTLGMWLVSCGSTIIGERNSSEVGGTAGTLGQGNVGNGGGGDAYQTATSTMGGKAALGGSATSPSQSAAGASECSKAAMPSDPTRPGYSAAPDPGVTPLLASMSLEQKIAQLYGVPAPPDYGDLSIWWDLQRSQDVQLINGKTVRGLKRRDGGRGLNLQDGPPGRPSQGKLYSTAFPAPSIRAASWDVGLEMSVGEAMGDETMASMNNLLTAPCVNIVRHPYWGRTQDAYGEDMHHIGRMASAFTAGVQQHVMACATHFAANNIEANRADFDAIMNEQTLREIYSRHFEMVVREGGVACVMAAYNLVNGQKSTQNHHLLGDILRGSLGRGGMGFRGFVISDLWAMPGNQAPPDTVTAQANAAEALKAGLDVEVPWSLNYSQLGSLVSSKDISSTDIDTAASRVLEQKARFKTLYTDDAWGLGASSTTLDGDSIANNQGHLDLAEQAELKAAVLLSNGPQDEPVLPIKNAASIAVVGLEVDVRVSSMTDLPKTGNRLNFATDVNLGDRGTGGVNADPALSIGPYSGIQAAALRHGITEVTTGTSAHAAEGADFVVVVVGLTAGDEGEEYSIDSLGDRTSLSIGAAQETLVNDVLALNKPTAIIVESGSIVDLPWLDHANRNQATIWAGYGGMRSGAALGRLLLGEANFSGKIPMAWPLEQDLPLFKTSARSTRMDYFHGYRYYDTHGMSDRLVFPFGWGLSYTRFEYANLTPPCTSTIKNNVVTYSVTVKNVGSVDGEEVVMLFVAGPPKPLGIKGDRPVKELKRFAKVVVAAGQSVKVDLPLDIQDLRRWEGDSNGGYVIDSGTYTVMVGPNAADSNLLLRTQLNVHE